ncbi:unnamed protein product [Rotaria sp. Silwood2]|nr:unnamed protein product [Rotaria sp. Silwood2]CAF3402904.1 unnamed protein product [Rotaria sp. Silwood2]CAF4130942.1 unnamed protein product [Rotaria sp. Silwood2]CAF4438155.1 unnamed protein product [Rotaria sp. Silwood2]
MMTRFETLPNKILLYILSYLECYEWLFNDNNTLRFPNLKSLILIRCDLIQSVVQSLFYLIKHQLDELKLTFDEHVFKRFYYTKKYLSVVSDKGNQSFI